MGPIFVTIKGKDGRKGIENLIALLGLSDAN